MPRTSGVVSTVGLGVVDEGGASLLVVSGLVSNVGAELSTEYFVILLPATGKTWATEEGGKDPNVKVSGEAD
jgi:hypothetical protein